MSDRLRNARKIIAVEMETVAIRGMDNWGETGQAGRW